MPPEIIDLGIDLVEFILAFIYFAFCVYLIFFFFRSIFRQILKALGYSIDRVTRFWRMSSLAREEKEENSTSIHTLINRNEQGLQDSVFRNRLFALKREGKELVYKIRYFWIFTIMGGLFLILYFPRNFRIWILFLIALFILGRKIQNHFKIFYLKKGDLFFDARNWEVALQAYQKLLKFAPHHEEGLYRKGLCLERMGSMREARTAFQVYLNKFPHGRWKEEIYSRLQNINTRKLDIEKKLERSQTPNKEFALEDVNLARIRLAYRIQKILEAKKLEKNQEYSSSFRKGRVIGDYELEEFLGQGGFGEVWKAREVNTNKIYSLKIPTDPEYIANLQKLGVLKKALDSPSIVKLEKISLDSEPPFVVMEYVEGIDLAQLLKRIKKKDIPLDSSFPQGESPFGPLSLGEVLHLLEEYSGGKKLPPEMEEILKGVDIPHLLKYIQKKDFPMKLLDSEWEAVFEPLSVGEVVFLFESIVHSLKFAHEQGIVHRDLKPANILLSKDGEIKLTDFELGKVNALASSLSLSRSHGKEIKGTLLYMAPEQMQGAEVDVRADIYSLGVILFEMVALDYPQPGDSLLDFNPLIPRELDQIFQKCYTRLEKRFSSLEEIEEILRQIQTSLNK
ncbi:MAG: hypothetical protein D6785_13900 [Planctomycetota bacterium]|nr:MAG: hypothetical protein D6785_13900 [Planctomycetota bacterium]